MIQVLWTAYSNDTSKSRIRVILEVPDSDSPIDLEIQGIIPGKALIDLYVVSQSTSLTAQNNHFTLAETHLPLSMAGLGMRENSCKFFGSAT